MMLRSLRLGLLGASSLFFTSAWNHVFCQETLTHEKDPTVPSNMIRKKLQTPLRNNAKEPSTIPKMELRAIVMSDSDRGIALLRVGSRSVTVQLRNKPSGTSGSNNGSGSNDQDDQASNNEAIIRKLRSSFQEGEYTFEVIAFSEESLMIKVTPGDQIIIVQ